MQRIAFVLYCLALVLAPLLFGAVHTYAYSLVFWLILCGTLLLLVDGLGRDTGGRLGFWLPSTPANALFAAVCLLLLLQMVPLPFDWLETLSPMAASLQLKGQPASSLASGQLEAPDWGSLAPSLYPVRQSLIRWLVYGLTFLGLSQLLRTRKRLLILSGLLLGTACFETLYGMVQTFSLSPKIWWVSGITDEQAVTGTYINRNHFAAFMSQATLLAFCLAAGLNSLHKTGRSGSLRLRLSHWFSGEHRTALKLCLLFTGLITGLGLIFSASKGGIFSLAAGLFCLGLCFVLRSGLRRLGLVILGGGLLIVLYALILGVDYPLSRFEKIDFSLESRLNYTVSTLELWADYPVFGVGVGNFAKAYPKHQTLEKAGYFIPHAHNDWAQFLAEAGLVGLALVLGLGAVAVWRHVQLWWSESRQRAVAPGALPLASLTAIGLHSFVDFSLHIPANCLLLAAVLAIGHKALYLEHSTPPSTFWPLFSGRGLLLTALLGLILWSGLWSARHFLAEANCNTVPNSTLNRDMNPALHEIQSALDWDGWNAVYHTKYALKLMSEHISAGFTLTPARPDRLNRRPEAQPAELEAADLWFKAASSLFPVQNLKPIQAHLERAASLNPLDASVHQLLNQVYLQQAMLQDPEYGFQAADIAARRAAVLAKSTDISLYLELARYWLLRASLFHTPEQEASAELQARALDLLQRAKAGAGSARKLKQLQRQIEQLLAALAPELAAGRMTRGHGDAERGEAEDRGQKTEVGCLNFLALCLQ